MFDAWEAESGGEGRGGRYMGGERRGRRGEPGVVIVGNPVYITQKRRK